MDVFKKLSFRTKLLLTVAFSCLVCGGISVGVAIYYNDKEFHSGLVEKSKIIHGRLDVVAKYVATQGGLKPMIEKFVSKYKDPSQLNEDEKTLILQQVPIYAAMKIGADSAEKDQYGFRVFSNEPRNKDNMATDQEMAIFKKFENDPNLTEWVKDEATHVTVYRPVRMVESHGCLTCHGNPSKSPWGNGKDILGYKMEDWKDGKLHGVFAVSNDVPAILKAESAKGNFSSTQMLAVFIFLGGVLALLISVLVVNAPLRALQKVANNLSETVNLVSSASSEIAASSQQLSESTTEQAASLEQTATAIDQLSSMVVKNTESAKSTATSSQEAEIRATSGKHAVESMVASIEEINQANEAIMAEMARSNEQMSEIVEVIKEIGNKTTVINEIVFQTKLLSFNASVEAARAGEHGKGFAVVAEEVGNLAQMSGNAAKEISDMLNGSISKVESIVQQTKVNVESLVAEGKEKLSSGAQVARQCGEILEEIVKDVTNVSAMANDISGASQEQATGISEINKAVNQLDQVTQQNSSASDQTAMAAADLSSQAETVRAAVVALTVTLYGQNGAEGSKAA